MPVTTPNFFAARFAAITMPLPCRPPPTQTGWPSSLGSSATSQLAKKLSPSTWRMRLGLAVLTCLRELRDFSDARDLSDVSLPIHGLTFQQRAFPVQAARKSAELPVGREHAMTRHQHGNRVGAASATHRADGFGIANGLGALPVAARFAGADLTERVPHALLKFRSAGHIQSRQGLWFLAGQCLRQGLFRGVVPGFDLFRQIVWFAVDPTFFGVRREFQSSQSFFRITG